VDFITKKNCVRFQRIDTQKVRIFQNTFIPTSTNDTTVVFPCLRRYCARINSRTQDILLILVLPLPPLVVISLFIISIIIIICLLLILSVSWLLFICLLSTLYR
jgi:hypothetical protein